MDVVRLDPFGAEITGLDLAKTRTAEESAELLSLFNEHYLLLFRAQNLSDDDHLRVFHDLFPGEDLGDETGTGSDVSYVSNVRPDGIFGDSALTFHSDFAFTTQPTRLISLYGYDVDPGSAPTEFSNGELALHALPADLRDYLGDKSVVCATDLISVVAHLPSYNLPGREDLSGRTHDEVVRAAWPVIMHHPRTGRPLIYVSEQHAHHLLGVPLTESREVLERVCGYLYDSNHIYRHAWHQGDFLLWDNIALSHGRRGTASATAKRTLRRVRGGGATRPTMTALSQVGLDEPEAGLVDQNSLTPELQLLKRTLGERIRSSRLARCWTLRELSDASRIDFQHVNMFELGIWIPSIPELCTLAGVLGADPGKLLDGLALAVGPPEMSGAI